MRYLILAACLLLANCGSLRYADVPETSKLSGEMFIMWLDGSDDGGDGQFIYVPSDTNKLTLIRAGNGPFDRIVPEMVYTDGGSLPHFVQAFRGFSPWSYGPAYLMHDYLFQAKMCDRVNKPKAAPLDGIGEMTFATSADILAETIKALEKSGRVPQNDIAPMAISSAVSGPISRDIWENGTGCKPVSDEDKARVKAALPGGSSKELRRINSGLEAGEQLDEAVIVGVLSF